MRQPARVAALLAAAALLAGGVPAGSVYPIRLDPAEGAVAVNGSSALAIRTANHYENRVALTVVAAATEPILRITAGEAGTTVSMSVTTFAFRDSGAAFDYYREQRASLLRKSDGAWQFNSHAVPGGSSAIGINFDLAIPNVMTLSVQTPAGADELILFLEMLSNKPVVIEELF